VKRKSTRRANRDERGGSGRADRTVTRLERDSFDFGSAVGAGADSFPVGVTYKMAASERLTHE